VIVSEFMLQQTQVSRVEAYYLRFLDRYPTVETLAAAEAAAVRESWAGLGYYRRAANLHLLARTVVREHAGIIPDDPEILRRLPGVGRYTAGAVASFAYERPTPAVDTNVARVIRRAFRPRGPDRRVWEIAAAVMPRRGKPPGHSTRPSWSWGRWCVPRGWRGAGNARFGWRVRRDGKA
jgi:A/G-specific adenine glycosylase